jgi:hypothetical protein
MLVFFHLMSFQIEERKKKIRNTMMGMKQFTNDFKMKVEFIKGPRSIDFKKQSNETRDSDASFRTSV